MPSAADIVAGAVPPEQDYIQLGGIVSPGRAAVVGAASLRDWDIRKGYGLDGAFVVYTGDNLCKFEVQIDLWEKSQFALWEAFCKATLGKPKARFAPGLDIKHPLLNREPLNIKSVIVEGVSQFEQDDNGLWSCRIRFIEYRKPKPALAKPLATIPNAAAPVATAQSKADLEIQKLAAEQQALLAKAGLL